MPRIAGTPKMSHHKASGQATVRLSGKDFYLGTWGTKTAQNEYDRVVAEWLAAGRAKPQKDSPLTVAEVMARYLRYVDGYYPGGKRGEPGNIREALKPVRRLYGTKPAAEFGPLSLKAVMDEMIKLEWARTTINRQAGRVRAMFAWAVANELIPASVHHGLTAVKGLRAGRSEATEAERVKPVPIENMEATIAHCGRHVGAMIRLQLLTGARPGEICSMRTCDIDTTGALWQYKPPQHKTAHHGHERVIAIGPKAQEVLRPFLRFDLESPIFSPAEADAERRAALTAARKTPQSCGNRPGTNVKRWPKRKPGNQYDVTAYRRAIDRAADAAGVPHWHPHQLRHTAATMLRKEYGIEAARVVLGHRSSAVTEIYAELDHAKAAEVMLKIG